MGRANGRATRRAPLLGAANVEDAQIDALLEKVMRVERKFANERKGQTSERRSRVREVIEKFAVETTAEHAK